MGSLEDLAELKTRMKENALAEVLELARSGRELEAATALDRLVISAEQRQQYGELLAYAYYCRALVGHAEHHALEAINDLEKARGFPGLSDQLRVLIQSRLTAIQTVRNSPEVKVLDAMIESFFDGRISRSGLLGEFMSRYRLSRPHRTLNLPFVDALSTVGVYRWKGDRQYGETWTKLIRSAKKGEKPVLALLSRILAEHFSATTECQSWLTEIDYIVPVPADPQRVAEREVDIVKMMVQHFGQRLGLPIRDDLLKRVFDSGHSRHLGRAALSGQYSFQSRKAAHVRGRTILLIDDVVTRGFTASVCAERLKSAGAAKVYLCALAQSESSHQTQLHFGESLKREARDLAPWLCLAGTEKLGPVRFKALLGKFESPGVILEATEKELRTVSDIGPKLAQSVVGQNPKLDEYAIRAGQLLDVAAKLGGRILTIHDEEYPQVLRNSNAAPAVLYALGAGKTALQELNTVAIVGSRKPVEPASELAKQIATAFAQAGWVIVSGMAEGVDSLAHTACLDAGQPTIAFLGNGVDVTYPPSSKTLRQEILRNGLLLSEYPFGTRTNENRLRRRNSLTVGQSRAVVIIQTTTDSGTMNAARRAKQLGRPLFCAEPMSGFSSQFAGNAELLSSKQAHPISAINPVQSVMANLGDHAT